MSDIFLYGFFLLDWENDVDFCHNLVGENNVPYARQDISTLNNRLRLSPIDDWSFNARSVNPLFLLIYMVDRYHVTFLDRTCRRDCDMSRTESEF